MIDEQKFQVSYRVYAEDTDFMGIVYHSNYLRFFERARTELFREAGWTLTELADKHDCQFVIYDVHLRYLQPAKRDDLLVITTKLGKVSACGIAFEQTACNQASALLCKAVVKIVCVDAALSPKKIPVFLKNASWERRHVAKISAFYG